MSDREDRTVVEQIKIEMRGDIKYALSRLQQKMGTPTAEATVERAFREFVEECGVLFREASVSKDTLVLLQQLGLVASENVALMQQLRGKLIVTLPELEEGGLNMLKQKSGAQSTTQVVAFALEAADRRYCR